jgi:hypothetical protein
MSRRWQTCILCCAFIGLPVVVTSAILVSRASTQPSPPPRNNHAQARPPKKLRNLALQPEAAAVNRRLGNRFKSANVPSNLTGQLILGNDRQPITIIRSQRDYGEKVEVRLAGRKFTWSDSEGIKGTIDSPTESERLVVERLVFDSADQFVLAQLRGASYQTIVRNLRPTDAGDDYAGPLWTMVRVEDPQTVESGSPKSPWRIYYINSQNGLIDRVECEVDGQKVEASMLQWTEQNGEKIPSHIKWTSNGQTVMEYQLTSFSEGQ